MPNVLFNKECKSCHKRYDDSIKYSLLIDSKLVYRKNGELRSYDEIWQELVNFYDQNQTECGFCGSFHGYRIWNITVNGTTPKELIDFKMEEIISFGFNISFDFKNIISCFLQKNIRFGIEIFTHFHEPKEIHLGGILVIFSQKIILYQQQENLNYTEVIKANVEKLEFDSLGNIKKVTGYTDSFTEGDINPITFDIDEISKSQLNVDNNTSLILRLYSDIRDNTKMEIEFILLNVRYSGNSSFLSANNTGVN